MNMSTNLWEVKNHVIPASYIRGAPRVVKNEHSPYLKLCVNQYTPKDYIHRQEKGAGALTIILIHGIGQGKETFEPFLDDLLKNGAPPIRNVWLPDSVITGKSYLENKDNIGDVHHSHDFARDILQMINYFQQQMAPPLVGMAYSYGCGALPLINAFHPRLFSGLVFLESSIGPKPGTTAGTWTTRPKLFPGTVAIRRKDTFASPDHTRQHLRRSPYYKNFDERVMDKLIQHEFRPLTEAEKTQSPDPKIKSAPNPVTLTTPRHLEAYQWLMADPPLEGYPPTIEHSMPREGTASAYGFFSPFAVAMLRNLQYIWQPVLLVWARHSPLNPELDRQYMLDRIGVGPGGSGGVAAGKVEQQWVEDATHPVFLEKPTDTAKAVIPWLTRLKESLDAEQKARQKEPPFLDDVPQEWKDRVSKI